MATVTFDGPNKLMIVQTAPVGGFVDLDVRLDLYSAWKNWLAADFAHPKYLPAFTPIGGEDIGGGESVGLTFLLRNGWSIRPYEADHTLRVTGNVIGEAGASIIAPTLGGYTVSTQIRWASLAQGVATGGSGLDTSQDARLTLIEKILRNRHETDPVTGKEVIYDDDGVTPLVEAPLFENVAGTVPYRGQGAERRDRLA